MQVLEFSVLTFDLYYNSTYFNCSRITCFSIVQLVFLQKLEKKTDFEGNNVVPRVPKQLEKKNSVEAAISLPVAVPKENY
jgi:hypothetical protein